MQTQQGQLHNFLWISEFSSILFSSPDGQILSQTFNRKQMTHLEYDLAWLPSDYQHEAIGKHNGWDPEVEHQHRAGARALVPAKNQQKPCRKHLEEAVCANRCRNEIRSLVSEDSASYLTVMGLWNIQVGCSLGSSGSKVQIIKPQSAPPLHTTICLV